MLKLKSVCQGAELGGVWIACILGIFLNGFTYAMLKWKTRRSIVDFSLSTPPLGKPTLVSVIIPGMVVYVCTAVGSLQQLKMPTVVFNEASIVKDCIEHLNKKTAVREKVELIIVNANSSDNTLDIVNQLSIDIEYRVLQSESGRGIAMAHGAAAARGEYLLFLHADTIVPFGYDELIRQELTNPSVIATAFRFKVNRKAAEEATTLIGLDTMEAFANVRAHYFQLPYGDQAISMRQTVYQAAGGYPKIKIMEDFELVASLRRTALANGRQSITILPAEAECSPRRWVANGVLKNTLLNQAVMFAYAYLGWSADRIYQFYYQYGC